jgi:protein transport protein SEC61 subunit alpha
MARDSRGALHLFRALAALIPAARRVGRAAPPFGQRVLCTCMSVSVFLMGTHLIPLYGVRRYSAYDPLYWARPILASNRGSLMELGVAPVVVARAAVQLLTGSELLGPVDRRHYSTNRELIAAARIALAMAISLVEAAAHVLLGMYGPVGPIGGALIALQLFSGGAVVAFLDGLLGMGYGLRRASAFSLLAATNTCGKIIWKIADAGRVSGGLVATFLVLLLAVFLHGCRVLLPISSRDARGRRDTLPVKLLYTSSVPIVLHSAAVSAFSVASQLLHYSRYGGGMVARLIGTWEEASYAAVPVGGLAYYVTPPAGQGHVIADPLHALLYAVLLLTSCALLSQAWATRRLDLDFPDAAIRSQVSRYIPTAAALGGLCVGALTILGDVTGAIGSGTGILLTATVVYNLSSSTTREAWKFSIILLV